MAALLSPTTTNLTPVSHYHSLGPSPAIATTALSSGSSSSVSLTAKDEEDITITASRAVVSKRKGKRRSQEDIRLLAISTHITELSYAISDVQTRIFEIQELRHKPQTEGMDAETTAEIDNAIMNMNERLETIEQGMKDINESVIPFCPSEDEPVDDTSERAVMLRKHAALQAEWDSVQQETDELQQELKEDKWITVFRTVTEQADGMMTSLEKAVNRCQDFIWQVRKRNDDSQSRTSFASSIRSEKSPVSLDVYNNLLGSFQAKKAHYVPATTKVLAIMDNGVRNRVTKNGEALRRHAEAAKRWRVLQERIERTEKDMEKAREILTRADQAPSEAGSTMSGHTANGYLATPPNGKGRAPSRSSKATGSGSALSRSMSPLRKFARKLAGSVRSPATPAAALPASREPSAAQLMASEPAKTIRRQRSSLFPFGGSRDTSMVVEKGHKHSLSLTPTSSPSSKNTPDINNVTIKPKSTKLPWNSSTKIEDEAGGKRPLARSVATPDHAPLMPSTPQRSLSRSSYASSRPWSPVTSSISTAPSSNPSIPPFPSLTPGTRPPSRAQTPSMGNTPRPRPRTPSGIPAPAMHWRSISAKHPGEDSGDDEDLTTLMQRAFSPALTYSTSSPATSSHTRARTPSGIRIPPPRPPSRSMIPLPSVHVSSESRPASTLSFYRPESPLTEMGKRSLSRAQTPESMLKARAQLVPIHGTGVRPTARPSVAGVKAPPSSFRDASTTRTPSRAGSRAGAYTPGVDGSNVYVPSNPRDPLDAEFAAVVNSIPHGLLIERVDPPLKTIPKEGEEIRASYAFSNSLSRKVVTCRLTTLTRSGRTSGEHNTTTKKVMCRVGGGWQDLQLYMLNRQAGM